MMFTNLSPQMRNIIMGCVAISVFIIILWSIGTFSARKQYRNKNSFSNHNIQNNLIDINKDEINNQASNKFHYDDRITDNVLNNGLRLDERYVEGDSMYRGPYGVSTRSAANDEEPVIASVKDVEPDIPVEVDSSQVKPEQKVVVKKEDVISTEKVVVKAKDVKPGERVIVKPVQIKPNQQVLKKSIVSGNSEMVNKEDADINEDVIADSSQLNPEEEVVVIASQVKPNKSVVTQGKSLSSDKKVVVNAEKVKPDAVVVVKASETKPLATVKSVVAPPAGAPQIGVPAASDGIEIEAPEPISGSTLENRLAGDAQFGQVYSMNKYPTRKAYATVSTRQKLSEFPNRTTVHTSAI